MRWNARWVPADLAAKAALAALLLVSLLHGDWARFADKAMTARAVAYPLLVAAVPLAWWYRTRGRTSYPALPAFLVTVPFVIDVAGNALDLYDTVDVFDDVCHFVNWAILGTALGIALRRTTLPPAAIAGLCSGMGAVAAILWELAEYGAFVTHTPERFTLYRDTMGDLALGLAGATLAGLVCAWSARRPAGPGVLACCTACAGTSPSRSTTGARSTDPESART